MKDAFDLFFIRYKTGSACRGTVAQHSPAKHGASKQTSKEEAPVRMKIENKRNI